MKRRIADLIAQTLVENGIEDLFSVVGGGAMFLNDAFGHNENLNVVYMNHEQACSMAAEGYVRATGKMAAVCVTTGPGGTNAITGVLGAFQDNYPMIVISGQVKYENCAQSIGLPLRFLGEQEHDIVKTVKPLTKYAKMVTDPKEVIYEIEKAIYISKEGRKGPCWIDVPLNIQGGYLEEVKHFKPKANFNTFDLDTFMSQVKKSKKPVILAGSALRSNNCVDKFVKVIEKLKIPVVTATYNADILSNDCKYYYGNFGIIGGRAGNFIVQNADLIIGMGCRMAYRQIGFNYCEFAKNAKKMIIDVDENELKKPTLKIDIPIKADIKDVLNALEKYEEYEFSNQNGWIDYCNKLKNMFPVYLDKFDKSNTVNPYFFYKHLRKGFKKDSIVVLGNSSIAGHILQMGVEKQGQRIINNMNCGSMGYDLPSAIGAAVGSKKEITLITGDGSIQMNLQELQTIIQYKLPIKIFICNNGGYRAIVRTQKNFFKGRYTGCTPKTGVGIPNYKRIAKAYKIPYIKISNHDELNDKLEQFYSIDGIAICEVLQDKDQAIEPKLMSRKKEDGSIVSLPIDDLYPFLDKETYNKCQFV